MTAPSPPERPTHGRRRLLVRALVVLLVLAAGVGLVSVRTGVARKAWRRLFPPKVGTVHVFGSGLPAVQPGPGPLEGPINTAFPGLTTFRGNASRDYYGEGPLRAIRRSGGSTRQPVGCAGCPWTKASRSRQVCRSGAAPAGPVNRT